MPRPVIERALDLFPITNFVNAYGLTETSSTISLLGPDDHRVAQYSDDPIEQQRLASVGRPLPGVEVQVRDDDGTVLGPGEVGEIFVRGEQVAGEYREKGSLLDADGWFPTRGRRLRRRRRLSVHPGPQRRRDHSRRREHVAGRDRGRRHQPSRRADAAAIGVPCREWGEKVVLLIVADGDAPDPDELDDLIRERLRSSAFPRTSRWSTNSLHNETGKLLRRVLREQFAHLGDDPTD